MRTLSKPHRQDDGAQWVAGVDGTRDGWVVALLSVGGDALRLGRIDAVENLLQIAEKPNVIAIDMPIGLLDAARTGGRKCDTLARRQLGPRRSSVFPPPVRGALPARTQAQANELNRRSSTANIGLGIQSFRLFPKLREVDQFMTPQRQTRFREVHPELSFRMMAGEPCAESKKTAKGRAERLRRIVGAGLPEPAAWLTIEQRRLLRAAPDDILDAIAAAWSAARILRSDHIRLPAVPEIDAKGLAMEILA